MMVEVSPAMLHWVTSWSIWRRTSTGSPATLGAGGAVAGDSGFFGSGARRIDSGGARLSGLGPWKAISSGLEEDRKPNTSIRRRAMSTTRTLPAISRFLGMRGCTGAWARVVGGRETGVGALSTMGSPHDGQWTVPRAAAGTKNSQ